MKFTQTDELIEHNNYVALYTFKNSIRESGRTMAELTKTEIDSLRIFAERSQGLSSIMAQNILGFFYEICFEEAVGGVGFAVSGEGEEEKGEKEKGSRWSSLSENIKVYPNPTTGELTITYPPPAGAGGGKITNVEIFDVYGRNVLSHTANPTPQTTINIVHLPTGLYIVKISTEAGEITRKVVKQ